MRGVSRIAEMSRITFWVNIYGFPKFNFSKNQFLSELDFHGVPPTHGIFVTNSSTSSLCHQLKYLSPFNVSKFFSTFFSRPYGMIHTTWLVCQNYTRTLNQNVVGVSLRILMKPLPLTWNLLQSEIWNQLCFRTRPWLTAV